MLPIAQIRTWQQNQLENTPNILTYTTSTISQTDATTYRDNGDGWTVLEVIGHLKDFEALFLQRAQLTLAQTMPDLPYPDPEQLVAEGHYNQADLQKIVDEWRTIRFEHITLLKSVPDTDWERPAKHPTRGTFTLHDQLFLTVWHDSNHLQQIAKIMAQKPSA